MTPVRLWIRVVRRELQISLCLTNAFNYTFHIWLHNITYLSRFWSYVAFLLQISAHLDVWSDGCGRRCGWFYYGCCRCRCRCRCFCCCFRCHIWFTHCSGFVFGWIRFRGRCILRHHFFAHRQCYRIHLQWQQRLTRRRCQWSTFTFFHYELLHFLACSHSLVRLFTHSLFTLVHCRCMCYILMPFKPTAAWFTRFYTSLLVFFFSAVSVLL